MPYSDKTKRHALTEAWRQRHPGISTKYSRKYRGLPEPTRPKPTLCELCGNTPKEPGLCLDHCHETGIFRGWLCTSCNTSLGKLGDNIAGLERAIQYLRGAIIVDGRKTG